MSKLNHLRIHGFRRLYDINLELRPMMVMIGANGIGKTSILDAVSLLSASASGNLNTGLSALGGIGSLLTRGIAGEVAFDVSMTVPGHNPLGYSIGTLRFLWLAALLQSPSLSTVTMIDEPEVSLHPELLSLLAELMREASARTQLIVATHSDRLIRYLKPEEVVVMDSGAAGLASAIWADQLDLEKWLADYTLDEVWRMGRMGARA